MPEDFGALRVVDLKEECKKRNLLVGGKKAELIARLEEFEAGQDGASEPAGEKPANASEQQSALPSGATEDVKAAAEEIIEADKPSAQGDAEDAQGTDNAELVTSEAVDAASPKTSSKGQAPSSKDVSADMQALAKSDTNDKPQEATAVSTCAADAEEGSKVASQPEPEQRSAVTPSAQKESAAVTKAKVPAADPVLESQVPAVEAPAASANDAASLKPATDVPTAAGGTDNANAQLEALKPTQPAPSGATAMDVDSKSLEPAAAPAAEVKPKTAADDTVSEKEAAAASVAEPDNKAAANTPAAETVPLVAALTDAGMGKPAAAEDAEMVQYDEQSDDDQAAPAKEPAQTHAKPGDSKASDSSKAQRSKAPSTSKAAKDEATPHASVRKRGRETDESARNDRKAPKTERQSDVKLSQRETEKERERERDRERAKDGKQANGNAPSDRRRKHAPISYKPPERAPSHADRDKATTELSRRESQLDKKPSATGAQDSATRKAGLERSVSRTESGHKLSVFERLHRSKGEGGSGPVAHPTRREPIPTPAPSTSKEALPRTNSQSRRNQPTQALRIDGFVRPLTVQKTQAMLSEFGEIQKLWMPSIRTHAFVVFATVEQAEKCLKETTLKNWPPGQGTLKPKFVTVEEADLAIARAGGGPAPVANGLAPRLSSDTLEAALPSAAAAPSERRAGLEEPRRSRDALDDRRRPREADVRDSRRPLEDAERQARQAGTAPLAQPALEPQVENPPTLDDLFRKTTTKPCLYWLPLTEAQAVERKTKLEAAAAEKAAAGEPVSDIAVPMAVV